MNNITKACQDFSLNTTQLDSMENADVNIHMYQRRSQNLDSLRVFYY